MLRINGTLYDGNVVDHNEDRIIIVVHYPGSFTEFADAIIDTKQIVDVDAVGGEKTYVVSSPLQATNVSKNVYSAEFNCKPTINDELANRIQEQSDAIDALLVMLLEG